MNRVLRISLPIVAVLSAWSAPPPVTSTSPDEKVTDSRDLEVGSFEKPATRTRLTQAQSGARVPAAGSLVVAPTAHDKGYTGTP